jgi:hypothetical protein
MVINCSLNGASSVAVHAKESDESPPLINSFCRSTCTKKLATISPRQYIRMQRRVLQVRRHFEVNSPPKRFDVFHMILHSIWLRRLNVGIHDDQLAITS